MRHSLSEKLFFLDNDKEVNRQVFKIGGIFMLVLLGVLAASYFDLFKIEPRDVLNVMGMLLVVELTFFVLLRLNAPVALVKYYGLLSMELCLVAMISNAYFGVYICYILVPTISCLYFDRRLTRNIILICYLGMLLGLWLRAPGAITLAFPGYTRVGWFLAFCVGYTLEYAALSAVLLSVSRRSRRYMEELYQRKEAIDRIQNKVIFRLADLVESRDGTTGKHVKRTSKYVVMIANRLRQDGPYQELLTEKDVANLALAAPLHDVGKIKIPDAILRKPGPLTEEEFTVIRTHTTEGQQIISSIMEGIEGEQFLSMARDIALSHHEKWDGTGYPRGLAGEQISLPARIMAVADVFDALVNARCYKQAIPLADAFDILRKDSGSHFDPYLVEVFLSAEDEIRLIMAEQ